MARVLLAPAHAVMLPQISPTLPVRVVLQISRLGHDVASCRFRRAAHGPRSRAVRRPLQRGGGGRVLQLQTACHAHEHSRFFWRVKIFLRDNIFLRILCETRSKCFGCMVRYTRQKLSKWTNSVKPDGPDTMSTIKDGTSAMTSGSREAGSQRISPGTQTLRKLTLSPPHRPRTSQNPSKTNVSDCEIIR